MLFQLTLQWCGNFAQETCKFYSIFPISCQVLFQFLQVNTTSVLHKANKLLPCHYQKEIDNKLILLLISNLFCKFQLLLWNFWYNNLLINSLTPIELLFSQMYKWVVMSLCWVWLCEGIESHPGRTRNIPSYSILIDTQCNSITFGLVDHLAQQQTCFMAMGTHYIVHLAYLYIQNIHL